MPRAQTFTEAEAKAMAQAIPDLVEIVRTYHGRTARTSATKNARHPQFIINHEDGDVSVAEVVPCPSTSASTPES